MSKDEFIKVVASDQPEVPAYFPLSAAQNLSGSSSLDVRQNTEYGAGHVPNAINIGLGGQFASWAGTLITIGTPVAIVAEKQEQVDEAFMRLARVGIEMVKGYILIGDHSGEKKVVEQVSVGDVRRLTESNGAQFVDVRRPAEHNNGHAAGTVNLPLDRLSREIDQLDPAKPTYVICQSGYRSSVATSMLENAGFDRVFNVTGGTKAWMDARFDTEVNATACAAS